jgi:curved DNA-binding protein
MKFQDYYKTLGVDKKASKDEIKKSFRSLARKYHPDKNPGDADSEAKFKEISEAYEVLSDSNKRKKYDRLGSSFNSYQNQGGDGNDFDWSSWYSKGNAQGSRQKKTVGDFFTEGGNMSDFFDRVFGSTYGAAHNQQSRRNQTNERRQTSQDLNENEGINDFETEVEVSLEQAFKGTKKRLKVNGESIEVRVKPGIASDQQLKIVGKGKKGKIGIKRGDLILNVKIRKDENIERKGDDLYIKHDIELYSAILGASTRVESFAGRFDLNIAPGTQQGKIVKLKSHGMPIYGKPSTRGDLFVIFNIMMPGDLDEKEIDLFKELNKLRREK